MKTLQLTVLTLLLSFTLSAQTLSNYSIIQDASSDWSIGGNGENIEFREPEQGNKLWAEFIDDWGLKVYGTIEATSALRLSSVGSSWIYGKTGSAGITFSSNLGGDAYFPLLRQTTESGHVANLGGYRDFFGFWGYKNSRTDNGYDYTMIMDLNTGNVGIGTSTSSLGSSSHKLSVEGSIAAREVVVLSSGWADFVFEEGYRLPLLSDVEKHINKNGHLPDIPSANEVEENGISVGEMNAKLLQKIEELTLYAIQQQKEIEILKEQMTK